MPRPPAPLGQLRDLELLVTAHHPLIYLETHDEPRAEVLLEHVADHLDILHLRWTPTRGLEHRLLDAPLDGTTSPDGALAHIIASETESLYHLRSFTELLEDSTLRQRLREAHDKLWEHRGAVVLTGPNAAELPQDIARLFTTVALAPPTDKEYHQYLSALLKDLRTRQQVRMALTGADVGRLLQQLRGLTFFEVKKVMTQAIAEAWTLDHRAIDRAIEAKKDALRKTGVLEYSPSEHQLDDIAGLERLKAWLKRRGAVFADPERAQEFGLTPPRGILLVGVPGCGKSLSAKAVASELRLPLIRLDPSRLYTKYVGETEENLRRAIKTAEQMAPIVLWIDELEKGLGPADGGGDAGLSSRIFGTFLSWMQDKPDGVFLVATANDVSKLPPEMLRKGRFDEIFFVDLPDANDRERILALHLDKRGRDPDSFDLTALAAATEGFSGSELEQIVVSGLYAAYADGGELATEHLQREIAETRPLSSVSGEKIAQLRAWAEARALPHA